MRVPVRCGMGLSNRIQAVGFTPAGAQDCSVYLVYSPTLFDVVLNGRNNRAV